MDGRKSMADLELKYLGEFEVLKGGLPVKLPPSRKTRALLAFLSLSPRRFRRDFLCELLWEIPDDPRGSLRWSLSKLRRLIDEKDHQRIVADRTFVEIDVSGASVDALELQALTGGGLREASLESLEIAASRYRGNFLEGMDLPNFHEFHAWCIAEREQVARSQAALLRELVTRLRDAPDRRLPYARALVSVSPYDETLRAELIRTLVNLAHHDEAEQQFKLGLRMLKEVGVAATGAMHAARNRAQPQQVASGLESTAPPARTDVKFTIESASGLVGRDDEAAALANLLSEVLEKKEARFGLIRGEPGMGKTRLVEAVKALARGKGGTVLSANAYESESIRPFALWIDALHRHNSATSDEIFADSETGNRDRLFDGLSKFVAANTMDNLMVLVFDDIHWCDESSAAAIHYVARMNRERPLLGILAARESELRDNVAALQSISGLRRDGLLTEVHLGPLTEASLAQLISERAPGVHAETLSRQCGGNPLLAIELARAEQEGDSSTSVTELVGERLARFSVDAVEVLQWAAVLSPRIDIKTISELTDLDVSRIGEVLVAAERQGMFTPVSGGVRWSHDLLTRAVYTTLSPLRRQVMHRRVAERLQENAAVDLDRAADLAHHAAKSGDAGLAARAMVAAGRMCLRFYANDEALSVVRRGLQLVEQLPDAERVCLTIDLNDVKLAAGPLKDWESKAREFAVLAERALDHGELAYARLGYHMAATVRWAHGQWTYAREESLQSERVVRSAKGKDHIVGMAETAKCLAMIERDLSKADALLMEATALATRHGMNYYAIPAGLGMLRFHENRMEEAEELLKESRNLCKSAGNRIDEFQANEYLMMIEFQRGRYAEALLYCQALQSISEKLRVGSEKPFANALAALCEYAMEDKSEALEPALEQLRVADAKHRLAYTLTRTAQIDCERGRLDAATGRATEALEYATLLQRNTEAALARAILACTSRAGGDRDSASEHEAAIAELEAAGVAAWATTHFRQEAGRQRGSRR
jgi:DNA-binding SARP family transcriptional activator/predicted ATPase